LYPPIPHDYNKWHSCRRAKQCPCRIQSTTSSLWKPLQGPRELRVPYYFMLFQGCLSTLEAGWACRLGVCRSSLHYSQANNGFFSSVAEPKNPVGKRKIVSVKLKEQCLEISVKQSDPDQPGRFLLALLNPSDVAVLPCEMEASWLERN